MLFIILKRRKAIIIWTEQLTRIDCRGQEPKCRHNGSNRLAMRLCGTRMTRS